LPVFSFSTKQGYTERSKSANQRQIAEHAMTPDRVATLPDEI